MAVVRFRVGPPGSGKTYTLVWEIVEEWATTHGGPVYCNLPLKTEAIEAYLDDRKIRCPELIIIPESETQQWGDDNGRYGPWEYFADKDMAGAWIIIDEVHNYVSTKHPRAVVERWKKWLGEIRHTGAVVDFVSQSESKVAKPIREHAPVRIELLNAEDRRDPICGIRIWDWYQLKAKMVGAWRPTVWRVEAQLVFGKWKPHKTDRITLEDAIFNLYDSFSAPTSGHGQSGKQPQPWERATWPQLLRWFVLKNFLNLFLRLMVVVAVLWLVFGGAEYLFKKFMNLAIEGLTGKPVAADVHQVEEPANQVSATVRNPSHTPGVDPQQPPEPLMATLIGAGNKTLLVSFQNKRHVLKQGNTWYTIEICEVNSRGAIIRRGSQPFVYWDVGASLAPDPLLTASGRIPAPPPPPSNPGVSPSNPSGPPGQRPPSNGPAKSPTKP